MGMRDLGRVLSNASPRVHATQGNDLGERAFLFLTTSSMTKGDLIMDKNRIDGAGKEIKGAAKEALGKVTGNTGKQIEGAAEKNIGKAQRKIGEVADDMRKH
jgi:uncharacterized protein YjbJ (UPF0337 family)